MKSNEWSWYPEEDCGLYFPLFNKIIHTISRNFMCFNLGENSRPTKNNPCDAVLLQVTFAGIQRSTLYLPAPLGENDGKAYPLG